MSRSKINFVSYAHCWPKESWYHSTSPPEAPLGCWGMGWLPQELLPTAPRLFWKRRLEAPWFWWPLSNLRLPAILPLALPPRPTPALPPAPRLEPRAPPRPRLTVPLERADEARGGAERATRPPAALGTCKKE